MKPKEAMDDLRLRARRTSSRTLATVAAAALIAIAVAGIVIAVLRGQSKESDRAAASAAAASAPKSPQYAGDLNHIVFAPDSDQLSPAAVPHIKQMAESTKDATRVIVLSGKIESASDRTARMDLAKKRITVVRRALQAHGIEPGRLRVEVAEYPVGVVPPREADIIEMYPR